MHHSLQMSFTNGASLKSLFGPEMPAYGPLIVAKLYQGYETFCLQSGRDLPGYNIFPAVAGNILPEKQWGWVGGKPDSHALGPSAGIEGGGRADTFQRPEAAKCVVAKGKICLGSVF